MKTIHRRTVLSVLGLGLVGASLHPFAQGEGEAARVFTESNQGARALPFRPDAPWLRDDAWYDGQAEVARYAATHKIYGVDRAYTATLYTNVQAMDRATSTKGGGRNSVEVFKHHRSERIPTKAYDYDYSTAVFVSRDDLSLFKQTFASQEDCGASFKQLWSEGAKLRWFESTYFPGGGVREQSMPGGAMPLTVDALPILLRSLDPELPKGSKFVLDLVDSWRDTHASGMATTRFTLEVQGVEQLDLPLGRLAGRRLDLHAEGRSAGRSYWFSTDKSAPMLGVLLAFDGPNGERLRLQEFARDAYWE